MASVELSRSWIALAADTSNQIVIPVLTAVTKASNQERTFVRFAGDKYPTAFRGEGHDRRMSLSCLYPRIYHEHLATLLHLLRVTAPAAPDSRLFLRTHAGAAVGLNDAFAVEMDGDVSEAWAHEAVTVTLPVRVVEHSLYID